MYLVTFVIALIFFLTAAILFVLGLSKLHQGRAGSRGIISSGFMVGLLGVVVTIIVFDVFFL